jgi:23S rRNA U2552 (ribose-2'-O)-methylase RlmE/FtsJ
MIHFQLPRNSPNLYTNLCYKPNENNEYKPIISSSLSFFLKDIKSQINTHKDKWDIYKRYTNPYEYIHTYIPNKKKCVSKHKPLSRSYFKMIELVSFFNILDTITPTTIQSFHLAEGPGGFIEALVLMRNNKLDTYTGMTILCDGEDINIPEWKKSDRFLKDNKNVIIENGSDGTGDILKIANFEYCKNKYERSMHIITGDGGFDFTSNYDKQEHTVSKLLFGQISYALVMQRVGGSFILKIFDCFSQHTIDMLALLSSCYSKVYITKPQTSRYANSEKYIVCKGFLNIPLKSIYPYLHKVFSEMLISESMPERYFNTPISLLFTIKLEEYNAIIGQQQIDNIYYTLSLIDNYQKNDKLDVLIKKNVQKCNIWCEKYGVGYIT